ncbi:hypothetical protein HOY80DRAFT_1076015 [Tuber brumale]|nr:hypothetical protein HOY80DRAFT_1076015 [Tuber brumale]
MPKFKNPACRPFKWVFPNRLARPSALHFCGEDSGRSINETSIESLDRGGIQGKWRAASQSIRCIKRTKQEYPGLSISSGHCHKMPMLTLLQRLSKTIVTQWAPPKFNHHHTQHLRRRGRRMDGYGIAKEGRARGSVSGDMRSCSMAVIGRMNCAIIAHMGRNSGRFSDTVEVVKADASWEGKLEEQTGVGEELFDHKRATACPI